MSIKYTHIEPNESTPFISAEASASGSKVVPNSDRYVNHRFHVKPGSSSVAVNIQSTAKVDGSGDPTGWTDILSTDLTSASDAGDLVVVVPDPWRYLRVEWSGNDDTFDVTLEQYGRVRNSFDARS